MQQPTAECHTGRSFVSWLLIFMALGALAPSILLPAWRDYQMVRMAEQVEEHRLCALQRVVARERRMHEATQDDPAVLARLAQRELGFRQIGRQPVPVVLEPSLAPKVTSENELFTPQPPPLPPVLARVASQLPGYDYDAVFCDPSLRVVVMGMSLGLLGVGLWLAPPRRGAEGAVYSA